MSLSCHPQWVLRTQKLRSPSVESPDLTAVLPSEPVVGQNIAIHVWPTVMNFFLVLISTFPIHSPSFFPNPLSAYQRRWLRPEQFPVWAHGMRWSPCSYSQALYAGSCGECLRNVDGYRDVLRRIVRWVYGSFSAFVAIGWTNL